ncbi:hypothetical protein C0J52_05507 [Blattella germanica]|nr:hypothetical protein C0J52_05507 [Blattella germanica]
MAWNFSIGTATWHHTHVRRRRIVILNSEARSRTRISSSTREEGKGGGQIKCNAVESRDLAAAILVQRLPLLLSQGML